MGKSYRQGRLGGEIKRIISEMLIRGIKDPRLSSMISISSVEVTGDGSYATCYVTLLCMKQDEELKNKQENDVLDGLKSAKGMFKREIGNQMKIRHVPELIFKIDNSMEYGRHIDSILDSLGVENYDEHEEVDNEDDF